MISNLYTALEKIRKGKNLEKNNRKILEKIKFFSGKFQRMKEKIIMQKHQGYNKKK